MKKLIFTNFLVDTTKSFFLVSLALSLIVWVIQSVNYLDLIIEDGHGFGLYFSYTVLNFPKIFSRLLPFLFFVTLFYKILEYEERNELIIFWSNGISKIEFINILIIFSILICFLQVLLSSYISPLGQNKARSLLKNSSIDFLPSLIKEGKFIDTIKGLTIFIDYKNEEQKYFNIFLTEEKINGTKKIIYAESGFLDINNNDKKFRLLNGKIIDQNEEKSIEFSFDEINFDLSKYQSKTITFPKIQETSSFKLLKCIIYNYKNKIQDYSETDFNCELSTIVVVQQEVLRRFHLPIYLPLLSLLCGLLVTKSKEYIYYNRFKYCLFSFIFSILVFSEISLKYSLINFSSFVFFITFPIIIFIIIYIIYSHEKKI